MIFLFLFSIISTSGCLEEEVKDSNNIDDSNDNYYNNPGDNSNNQNSDNFEIGSNIEKSELITPKILDESI